MIVTSIVTDVTHNAVQVQKEQKCISFPLNLFANIEHFSVQLAKKAVLRWLITVKVDDFVG